MHEKLIYLASPYSHEDKAVEAARFESVCKVAAALMREGQMVFSPIAHTHPIALAGDLPRGFDYYAAYDELMISRCDELYVLMLDGWRESVGVTAEVEIARRLGKRVRYVTLTPDAILIDGNPIA